MESKQDWVDAVYRLQEAQMNNRLVVFVGAGVSKNSGIPLWGDLIRRIAENLNYDNCSKCGKKLSECNKESCTDRYKFSQDEFLRIPEYQYIEDKSKYENLITETLGGSQEPNDLNKSIIRLLPHHIITTNYDTLLEDAGEVNNQLYTVISKDKDMLLNNSEHYIIKMHGDIKDMDSIVLKESDYINYEQSHVLISTYIRSLLIDHSFLFVGYSLNDYNLKLIIGWIDYLAQKHEAKERPQNYILQNQEAAEHERKRLRRSNIEVVDLSKMPEDFVNGNQTSLQEDFPKRIFGFTESIQNPGGLLGYVSLEKLLMRKYELLKPYEWIAFDDLKASSYFGHCEMVGDQLILYDSARFEHHKKMFEALDQKNIIIQTIQKSGIKEICDFTGDEIITVSSGEQIEYRLKCWLDNDYKALAISLSEREGEDTLQEIRQRLYYCCCLGKKEDQFNEMLEEESKQIQIGDYISILHHKISRHLLASWWENRSGTAKAVENVFDVLPKSYRKVVNQFEKISHSSADDRMEMQKMLNRQIDKHLNFRTIGYSESAHHQINKLQSYVYDYYMFMKINGIMLDNFSNPKDYFCYYLEAIICSYYNVKKSPKVGERSLISEIEKYPINDIDFDMFVKYCTHKNFGQWIKKYSVQQIALSEGVDVVKKFKNYCDNFCSFADANWEEQLRNFILLIGKVELRQKERVEITISFIEMIKSLASNSLNRLQLVVKGISAFDFYILSACEDDLKDQFLDVLVENYSKLTKDYIFDLDKTYRRLAKFASPCTKKKIANLIDEIEPVNRKIHLITIFLEVTEANEYSHIIKNNMNKILIDDFVKMVWEKVITSEEDITEYYTKNIHKEIETRETGFMTYPDRLTIMLGHCVILAMHDMPIDINQLEPYMEYSNQLEFLLRPESFDYSKIDLDDGRWVNFFRREKYHQIFRGHKKEILEKNKFKITTNEDSDICKIVYGVLMETDELWKQ